MLPDRCRQLLTAYVDGELSGRQRRQVRRLLDRSAEARKLLRELQGDSEVLRALPSPPPLGRDLSAPVLRTIAALRLRPGRPAAPPGPRFPAWVGYLAAASVLCAVGLSAYLAFAAFFAPSGTGSDVPPLASTPATPRVTPERPDRPDVRPPDNRIVERPELGPGPDRTPEREGPDATGASALVEGLFRLMRPDLPDYLKSWPQEEEKEGKVLAAPGQEFSRLKEVRPVVPAVVPLREADPEPSRRKLIAELGKAAAYRVELPCGDGNKALHKIQTACKEHHVPLVIEANAQALLKKADARPSYVLYLDGVMPEELAELLLALGAEERKGKPADAQFEMAVLRRLNDQDHKELRELIGADPLPVQASKEETTNPRPPAVKTAPGKPAEYQALAMVYNPGRPSRGPEVKRFLDGRKPPRPGSLQVMLVLRAL
jgi:hypothetical protein